MQLNKRCKEFIKECLEYCPRTGLFVWKIRPKHHFKSDITLSRDARHKAWNSKYSGRVAGGKTGDGYISINLGGKLFKAHRLAFMFMDEDLPEQVDHLDQNRLNNKWGNLVASNNTLNHRNIPRQRNSTTGVTGVSVCKRTGRYETYINYGGKKIRLGRFDSLQDAKKARAEANLKYGFSPLHGRKKERVLQNGRVVS